MVCGREGWESCRGGGREEGGGKAAGTIFEIGLGGRIGRGGGARLEWKSIFINLNFFVFHPQALRILVIDRLKGAADGVVRRSLPGWWYFTWLDWLFYTRVQAWVIEYMQVPFIETQHSIY